MHEPRDAAGLRLTRHRPMLDAAVCVEHAEGCRFTNCQFVETGNSGLWLAGNTRNCVIRRCRFRNLGGNGLNLGEDNSRQVAGRPWYLAAPEQVPTNNRVEQCEISYCGTLLPGAVGLWAPFNRGLQILDNHIHDCPYSGISLGGMWNPSETPCAGRI
ncbi:MAG: right-handed parallel beta-helix repeat-containing protein [Planctomycetaceae bacterium]